MPPALLDELIDWLRIPSISTGGGRRADLDAANESFSLHGLELGERAARELPLEIAQLPT